MSPPAAKSPYAGYRFPAEVISQAVWLYLALLHGSAVWAR
jgi:transposase-like protein